MRVGEIYRRTRETEIYVRINIDETGEVQVNTPYRFLNHLVETLLFYAGFSGVVEARELKPVDDHHVVEDVAICIGQAVSKALGDRGNIARYGWAIVPMDDACALAAVDLGGRVYVYTNYSYRREKIGDVATENILHFYVSLAQHLQATIHVHVLAGLNEHHIAEASFKALGMALGQAVKPCERVLSTKGEIRK